MKTQIIFQTLKLHKFICKNLIFLLLLISGLIPNHVQAQYKIYLKLKDSYLKGEFVYGTVSIVNNSNEIKTIPSPNQLTGGLHFEIRDYNTKKSLGYTGMIFEGPDEYIDICQGDSITEIIELANSFGNDPTTYQPQQEFKIGKYSAKASINDITSDEVYFSVQDIPEKEIDVYSAIRSEAVYNPDNYNNNRIVRIKNLIDTNQNSHYLPNLYLKLFSSIKMCFDCQNNAELLEDMSITYIKKYPDTFFTRTALFYYIYAIKAKFPENQQKIEYYIKQIKRKNQDKLVSRFAEDYINIYRKY